MANRQLDNSKVLNTNKQKFAKFIHRLKATFRTKERKRCQALGGYFPESSVVFDVGGHFGYFSKEFAILHKGSCQIHAFEPTSYNYSILNKVCSTYKNIILNNFAFSDQNGHTTINIPVKEKGKIGPGLAHFGDEQNRDYISETIKTVTLDQYVTDRKLTRLDFIKCDVEGAELLVFKGSEESLSRFKPVVFAEIGEEFTRRMGYEPGELIDLFLKRGYRAHMLSEKLILSEELDHYVRCSDYLFLPPGYK